jgi:hypothetical protein
MKGKFSCRASRRTINDLMFDSSSRRVKENYDKLIHQFCGNLLWELIHLVIFLKAV